MLVRIKDKRWRSWRSSESRCTSTEGKTDEWKMRSGNEIQEYKIDDLLMREKKKPQGCQGCSKGCNNKNQGCNKGHGKRKN